MTTTPEPTPFTICEGGRLNLIFRRLARGANARLVTVALVLIIGWLPVVVLAAIAGTVVGGPAHSFFADFGPWVRFFLFVPVALLAEPVADRTLGVVVEHFRNSGLLPETHREPFEAHVAHAQRSATSDAVELTLLIIALIVPHMVVSAVTHLSSDTATWTTAPTGGLSAAGRWYAWVSLPIAQFLVLRWLWRILVWARLLWQTSRTPLALTASHPDRMGGLEFVTFAPLAFVPVLAAVSALASAASATAITLGHVQLLDLRAPIAAFVVIELLVLLAPQLFFAPAASRARRRALLAFAATGGAAARAFAHQWTGSGASPAGDLLESNHPGATADYAAMYTVIQETRPSGLSIRRVVLYAVPLLTPFAPLLLFKYSLRDIFQQLLQMVR